jgi:hypothetical protein
VQRARTLGLNRLSSPGGLATRTPARRTTLSTALTIGALPLYIQRHIADALELDTALVEMAATTRQREDEWRVRLLTRERAYLAAFRPHASRRGYPAHRAEWHSPLRPIIMIGIIHDANECHDETIVQLYGEHVVRLLCPLDEVLGSFT